MNEGENSTVPQKPVFSSPNTSSEGVNSFDNTKPVAGAINSGSSGFASASNNTSARSRFGFSSRRYSSNNQFSSASMIESSVPVGLDYDDGSAKHGKKKFVIVAVVFVVVIAAVGLLAAFSLRGSDGNKTAKLDKKATAEQIIAFEKSCDSLIGGYSPLLEQKPFQALKKRIEKNDFFLVDKDWIDKNKKNVQNYEEALVTIKDVEPSLEISDEQKGILQKAITDSEDLYGKIKSNVELLSDFYDVFGATAEKIVQRSANDVDCNNPSGVEKLAKYNNARDSVTYFKSGLCDLKEFMATEQDIDTANVFSNFTVAKRQLSYALTDVSEHSFKMQPLYKLKTQLESNNEKK